MQTNNCSCVTANGKNIGEGDYKLTLGTEELGELPRTIQLNWDINLLTLRPLSPGH